MYVGCDGVDEEDKQAMRCEVREGGPGGGLRNSSNIACMRGLEAWPGVEPCPCLLA